MIRLGRVLEQALLGTLLALALVPALSAEGKRDVSTVVFGVG